MHFGLLTKMRIMNAFHNVLWMISVLICCTGCNKCKNHDSSTAYYYLGKLHLNSPSNAVAKQYIMPDCDAAFLVGSFPHMTLQQQSSSWNRVVFRVRLYDGSPTNLVRDEKYESKDLTDQGWLYPDDNVTFGINILSSRQTLKNGAIIYTPGVATGSYCYTYVSVITGVNITNGLEVWLVALNARRVPQYVRQCTNSYRTYWLIDDNREESLKGTTPSQSDW